MNNSTRMMLVKNRQMHEENNKDNSNYGVANERIKLPVFDRDTAEHWVSEMESRDGTKGGKWTYEQTTQVMKQKGFDCDPADFFAAMNSIYSDYGKTLTKYAVTSLDTYADLAYDWVKDPDAYKDKAARYYEYIVK